MLRSSADGPIRSARAKELFAEDVVMNQYEELFFELEQRRFLHPGSQKGPANAEQAWIRCRPLRLIPAIPSTT